MEQQVTGRPNNSAATTERPGELARAQEQAREATFVLSSAGAIEHWDRGAELMYGYAATEVDGRPATVIESPGEAGVLQRRATGCHGPIAGYESEHVRRDGTVLAVDVTLAPRPNLDGQPASFACRVRDLTAMRRETRELERLRDAAEHAIDAVISVDLDGRIRHWSRGAERLFGCAAEDVLGRDAAELGEIMQDPKAARERQRAALARLLAGEPVVAYESVAQRTDGSPLELLTTWSPWRVDGEVVGLTSTVDDITERRRAERLARIVDSSHDAIFSTDLQGRITTWNSGAVRMLGFTADEIIGEPVSTLVPEDRTSELEKSRRAVYAGEAVAPLETVRRTRDGRLIDVSVTLSPLYDAARGIVGAGVILRDISERRRADITAARLAAIVDASGEGVVGADLEGRITSWNRAAERITGYCAAEVLGRRVDFLTPPDRLGEVPELLVAIRAGQPVAPFDTVRLNKDGDPIDVSVTVTPIRDDRGAVTGVASIIRDASDARSAQRARERALLELADAQQLAKVGSWTRDIATGETTWSDQLFSITGRDPARGAAAWEELRDTYIHPDDRGRISAASADAARGASQFSTEFRLVGDDGRERFVVAIARSDGERVTGAIQDVTERRMAEQERLALLSAQARAEAANRAKSEFLAQMSHELRTPLNAIIGFGQLLELADLSPRDREDLGFILKAGTHLLALIDDVLDIARIEAGRMTISAESVPVAEVVDDVCGLMAAMASERNIELARAADAEDSLCVLADRNRLKQVLLNLVSNAIKYNRSGGRVDVGVKRLAAGRAGAGCVSISVSDTGFGIADDLLAQLFEPFERLGAERTEIEGTGLGLTLSKGLIEAMGGSIEVSSKVGAGTTFAIELTEAEPFDTDQSSSPPELAGRLAAIAGRWKVLYIEDNLSNFALVQRIFDGSSVELLSAMQGTIGIELARSHSPDLVVLDLHLPDMPGADVLVRLKAEFPALPVIVLTADATGRQAARLRRLGVAAYLTKPLDVAQFCDVVSDCLPRVPGRAP